LAGKRRIGALGSSFSTERRRNLVAPRRAAYQGVMEELLRTNNPVTLSFVESLMREAGIGVLVADENMSIMDGSLGILPRRVLVDADRIEQARRILRDAGLENELKG
jgi:hypothetical protein